MKPWLCSNCGCGHTVHVVDHDKTGAVTEYRCRWCHAACWTAPDPAPSLFDEAPT